MRKEKVLQKIEQYHKKNEDSFSLIQEEYALLQKTQHIEDISELIVSFFENPGDAIFLVLRLQNKEISYSKLKEKVLKVDSFLSYAYGIVEEKITKRKIEDAYPIFMKTLPKLLEMANEYKHFLQKTFASNKQSFSSLSAFDDPKVRSHMGLIAFWIQNHFHNDVNAFFEVFSLFENISNIEFWFLGTLVTLKQKSLSSHGKKLRVRSMRPIDDQKQMLDKIESYFSLFSKQYTVRAKEYQIQKDRLRILQNILENQKENEYISFTSSLDNVLTDDALSLTVLEYIYQHNCVFDQKLEKEYEYLKENSYDFYFSIFQKYGYHLEYLDIEQIEKLISTTSVYDMKRILSFLNRYHYVQDENFLFYLYLEDRFVSFLEGALGRGYFDFSYLCTHIKEISENSSSFQKNIEILSLEVPTSKIKNSSLFFMETDFLKQMLYFSHLYQIDLKNVSLQFLSCPSAFQNLDAWIELGEKDFILSHTQYLKNDLLPMQVKLASLLHIPYCLDGKLEKNLPSTLGYIQEEDLYKALMIPKSTGKYALSFVDTCVYLKEIENKLEEYALDFYTYVYEGIRLSKYRIFRILSSLVPSFNEENEISYLYYALTEGTFYTEEERKTLWKLATKISFYIPYEKVKN